MCGVSVGDRGPDEVSASARRIGIEIGDELAVSLATFAELLADRAVPLGMLARDEIDRIVPRHVVDSLRAAPAIRQLKARSVVDLGSGAGLPGIVAAIALPDVALTLAEVRSKRAAFLELAVERLSLTNVTVHPARAEELPGRSFDVATARAFAPPLEAWDVAHRLLRAGGSLVLFAGARERVQEEFPGAHHERFRFETIRERHGDPDDSWRTSPSTGLATGGDLVIITST